MLTLTETAINKVKEFMTQYETQNVGLRIKVVGGGCSGLSYQMHFDENVNPDDEVIEFDGVKVLVDEKSTPYLRGTELDYVEGLMGKGFTFRNPNAKGSCGCGESFNV